MALRNGTRRPQGERRHDREAPAHAEQPGQQPDAEPRQRTTPHGTSGHASVASRGARGSPPGQHRDRHEQYGEPAEQASPATARLTTVPTRPPGIAAAVNVAASLQHTDSAAGVPDGGDRAAAPTTIMSDAGRRVVHRLLQQVHQHRARRAPRRRRRRCRA